MNKTLVFALALLFAASSSVLACGGDKHGTEGTEKSQAHEVSSES